VPAAGVAWLRLRETAELHEMGNLYSAASLLHIFDGKELPPDRSVVFLRRTQSHLLLYVCGWLWDAMVQGRKWDVSVMWTDNVVTCSLIHTAYCLGQPRCRARFRAEIYFKKKTFLTIPRIIVYYANKVAKHIIKSKLKYKNTHWQEYIQKHKKTSHQNHITTASTPRKQNCSMIDRRRPIIWVDIVFWSSTLSLLQAVVMKTLR